MTLFVSMPRMLVQLRNTCAQGRCDERQHLWLLVLAVAYFILEIISCFLSCLDLSLHFLELDVFEVYYIIINA